MSRRPRSSPPTAGLPPRIRRSLAVARAEFVRIGRSRSLRALFVLLLAATVLAFVAGSDGDPAYAADAAVGLLGLPFQLTVPVAAILAGCFTLAGDRDAGTVRLLLGLSASRTEVVAGTFLGAFAALTLGVAAAVAVAVPASLAATGRVPASSLAAAGIATTLLAGAFLGVAVGAAALASTRKRSIAIAVGAHLTLLFLWEAVVAGASYAATGSLPTAPLPVWLAALDACNPIGAYARVAVALGAETVAPLRVSIGLLGSEAGATTARGAGGAPVYLSDPFAVAVLGLWTVIPLAVGTLRLRRRDL
ncbi:ABC transporter permease [Halorubrum lipolyticum]|uniref:ABC-2 type transporter n=1 Tax=Halorubrum lipolyticum DSM 21995 TaxID=1227482 RepID=M0NNJ7_9EURY|nr:ABC transporter permease subunit [Halorubrum lipolyticum]EMA58230.1 ABC-2 type transporter [Halorubrum lipolyticum DSM 21995]